MPNKLQFLAKGRALPPNPSLALDGNAKVPLQIKPLFKSIGKGALGAAGAAEWFQVSADIDADAVNPWDACYTLLAETGGALRGAEFVEPDLQQRWPIDST